MDDRKIVELYFARDESAIRETEKKYSSYLFVTALNILNSREDSSECVNDTYFKAWNAMPPHEEKNGDTGIFKRKWNRL